MNPRLAALRGLFDERERALQADFRGLRDAEADMALQARIAGGFDLGRQSPIDYVLLNDGLRDRASLVVT